MFDWVGRLYEALVLRRPWITLCVTGLVVMGFALQTPKIRLDASADSLMLQGDPSLEYFREMSREYDAQDFMLVTWAPHAPLLSPESLQPLGRMADELRQLEGVGSVLTVLDVPLLQSPPVSLSDVTDGDGLSTLQDPSVDRELALKEFTSSPIYADLLVSRDGELTAVQINLARDERYHRLLDRREDLRSKEREGELDAAGEAELARVKAQFKAYSAKSLARQSELVSEVRAVVDGYRDDAQLFVGGVPMIAADMVRFVRSDLEIFSGAIVGVMSLVLALIFRRVRWVVIPVVTCGATVTVMLGLLGALDWRMTVISSNFVAVLLIIALAIAIHLVVRYRELHVEKPEGDLYERVRDTVGSMAVPCVYTGLTTIVAFVSLVVSGIQPVIDFGWMMTVGIFVALVMCFTLVPCLMLVWPRGRPFVYRHHGEPFTVRFARLTDRLGNGVLWISLALFVLILWGISRLEVENRFIDYFEEETEIYQGMKVLDEKLGGTIPLDIVLDAPQSSEPLPGLEPVAGSGSEGVKQQSSTAGDEFADEWNDEFSSDFGGFESGTEESFEPSYWFTLEGMRRLEAVHDYLDKQPETGKVLSLATVFEVVRQMMGGDIGSVELALVQRKMPPEIEKILVDPYFSLDENQARINARVMETSKSLRRDAFLERVRAHLVDDIGIAPENVHLTGMLVLYNNVLQSLFRSQILTLGAVFCAILVMFYLLFRSLRLALIALAPNVLAAGLVLGVMGIAGIPLDIMTITIAAIVIGIGVDDCIHYVHRYRREFRRDRDYVAAMYRSHRSIGRAMYYTTVTVVVGFSMLTLSNFTPSVYFGLLTVLAMVVAVVGALMLLPRLILWLRPLGEGEG